MNYSNLKAIFELGRPMEKDSNFPYIHLAYKYKKDNYRLITSGELFIRGKNLIIPQYIIQFMTFHQEAVMIANKIDEKIISIVFRSINTNKEFSKFGTSKSTFYGLGDLSENFRYGTPIILVEGHLDRDMMSVLYPNVLGVTTSHLSKSQIEILSYLTNKFILMFDNDEAGIRGQNYARNQLKGNKIYTMKHNPKLKDAGDLVKLDITNHSLFEEICLDYSTQIMMF